MKLRMTKVRMTVRETDGGFIAETSEFPGCTGHGASHDEAVRALTEAVKARTEDRTGGETNV